MNQAKNIKDYTWPVTVMLYDDYLNLKACIDKNKTIIKLKQLVIFGAGIRGSLFAVIIKKLGYNDILFSDNNPEKWGGYIYGYEIIPPEQLKTIKDRTVVLVSVENGYDIIEQLCDMGFVINENCFFIETDIYKNFINEMKRPIDTETLIIGDCGLSQISLTDQQTNNLAKMLREQFGIQKTKVLAMHGMGMRSFYHVIKAQLELEKKIRNLILMVNFEVFTGKHHILPRTQHIDLIQKIHDLFANTDDELKEYVELVKKRASKLQLDVYSQIDSPVIENEHNARLVFIMNYMYHLRKDTEDMQYLIRILKFAEKSKINVLPYIPPANYMYAKEILGKKFTEKYDENCQKMKSWIRELGFDVLDMSYLLSSDCFADLHTIDETANYLGRLKILEEIKKEFAK